MNNNIVSQDALVTIEDGTEVTDTLTIAREFNKRHTHVLEIIEEKLHLAELSAQLKEMFFISEYVDSSGKRNKMYKMNRDGFMFLVTSFKGKKADLARLAFIKAFNYLERQFNTQVPRPQLKADFTTDSVRIELFNNAPVKVTEHEGLNYYFFNDVRLAAGYRKSASRPWRNMRPLKKVHVINQDKVPNGIYNVVTVKELQLIINDHGANSPQLQVVDRFIKVHRDELTEQTTLLLIEPEQTSLDIEIPAVEEQIRDFEKFKEFQTAQGWI